MRNVQRPRKYIEIVRCLHHLREFPQSRLPETLQFPLRTAARPISDAPAYLHEYFERVARRSPERIAIDTPPGLARTHRRRITYAELEGQANALGRLLRPTVKGECVVAILLPRDSEHLYLAQLAVLKSGAAYTCIDPVFPDGQILDILTDSQAVAVLSNASGVERVQRIKSEVGVTVDVIAWAGTIEGGFEPLDPAPWLTPGSLAYLIYTSGTTGRPKGVMIEHRSITNLVQGDLQTLGITPLDRCAQSASPAYDSSVEETWFALSTGATLVVMDDHTTRLGPDLIAWLQRERVTVFAPSPSLLRATGCGHPEKELPDLRLIHVGGEMLPPDVAERWAKGRRFVNDYGPTETTVTALRGPIVPGAPITIGRPVPGVNAWVLDDKLDEVEAGAPGELCLGGIALARGYMNDVAMTARKFPVHPRLGRVYRTGDLVQRKPDGSYSCLGRIDAQVKIRGYRIELEAIEARLAECAGVRAAVCRVQGEGSQAKIAAYIVPTDRAAPPAFATLANALHQALPPYMVPSFFGLLSSIPTSVSGKVDRKALPLLAVPSPEDDRRGRAPQSAMEKRLEGAFRRVLRLKETVSIDDDFFRVLGGDSLLAAELISMLRDDPATASLTVRDLYEMRTVAELAKRSAPAGPSATRAESTSARPTGRPVLATLIQAAWLVLGLGLSAPPAYGIVFHALPALDDALGFGPLVLLAPVLYFAALAAYTLAAVSLAVAVKKVLIGRYQPIRAPAWGSFHVRHWMVQQTVRLVPWGLLGGTVFQTMILRRLGARIGERVHIHRGVNLTQGGWDLLEIGDHVTLSQDAALQLVEFEAGQLIVGPTVLEKGCTLGIRASVASDTHMEANASLAALSFLPRGSRIPRGEHWGGVPATCIGRSETSVGLPAGMSPLIHGLAILLGRVAVAEFVALPLQAITLLFVSCHELHADWLLAPSFDLRTVLLGAVGVLSSAPLMLLFQGLALRYMGRVRAGVISRWSLAYVRVWLKAGVVDSASHWLSGTLLWPVWLRLAGMKIGRGSEISTIIDTIPELVETGEQSFFADGIYLGGPGIHQGTVTLAPVRFGRNTFLGNHAVVAAGQHLPEDILIGVCTTADDTKVRPGTSWFGHPPFDLPKREVIECDRRLTHDPTLFRWLGRLSWELARFTLPFAPVVLGLAWLTLLVQAEAALSRPFLVFVIVPAVEFGFLASLCLLVLLSKWALLGRVRPAQHPLYSSWCSRWDFLYVVWDLLALGPLTALEGTLWLNAYLRAMGMRIGRNVVLGPGFAHVVDPDMLTFEDGATVSCQFQAHTFEDRVLKIDRVIIRRQATVGHLAVLLYGADIGANASVAPLSVVMKRERLLANLAYAGSPTRPMPVE